jgi:menaquinone-dependent protoporphyrinogen oxidase
MAEVLIVYATLLGYTRRIAERVAEDLRAGGHAATLVEVSEAPAPGGFDAAIVGAPVRSASFLESIEDYVRAHAGELRSLPSALFSVCAPDEHDDRHCRQALDGYLRGLQDEVRWQPDVIGSFAGLQPFTHIGLAHQVLGADRSAPTGPGSHDESGRVHEGRAATDWDAVSGFVEAFVHHLARSSDSARLSSARRASA